MSLALFHTPVGTRGAWRRPGSGVEQLYRLEPVVDEVRRAEAAKLDAVLFADVLAYGGTGADPDLNGYEPITLMAALVAVTERIGLVATASTTFSEPYHVARQISGVDHLSGGRAGWNIVTSRLGERNFGSSLPPRADRYARADEFVDVVTRLWDAWEPDAVVNDREAGVWARDEKIRRVDFAGEWFSVEGPMIVPRSPQGRPVLFQAGQSEEGRGFAAKWADVIFTAQTDIELAKAFADDMRQRIAEAGRDPELVKILPGVGFVFGDTEEEAEALDLELTMLAGGAERIPALAREMGGIDLSGLGLADRVPAELLIDPAEVERADVGDPTLFFEGSTSRYANLYRAALEGATISKLLRRMGGHGTIVGTPQQAADEMERWFRAGACDGFIVSARYLPEGVDRFLSEVVPLLQARGVFRTEYAGSTLREVVFAPRGRALD